MRLSPHCTADLWQSDRKGAGGVRLRYGDNRFISRPFARRSYTRLLIWTALFAVHRHVQTSRSQQEAWRERPQQARWKSSRACPEGALTPWVQVSSSLSMKAGVASTCVVIGAEDSGPIAIHFVRTIKLWFVHESWITREHSLRAHKAVSRMRVRVAIVGSFDVCDACADHHTFDAGSVLGTVQGSSLRDDRACARPAGLDSACAQIMSWPLWDGRRSPDFQWTDLDC